jgi:hypothetical protein
MLALAAGRGLTTAEQALILLSNPAFKDWFLQYVFPHLIHSAVGTLGMLVNETMEGDGNGGGAPNNSTSPPPGSVGNLKGIRDLEHLRKHGWPSPFSQEELVDFARSYILGKAGIAVQDKNGVIGYAYTGLIRGVERQAILRPDGNWVSLH